MAVAVGTVTTGTVSSSTGLTFNHNATGASLLMVYAGSRGSGGPTVTGVTFNGVAMTLVDGGVEAQTGGYWYYLLAPDTGAHNVVVSFSGTVNAGGTAVNLSWTSTTAPIGGYGKTQFNGGTTATRNTTCVATSILLAGFSLTNSGNAITVDGSQTSDSNFSYTNSAHSVSHKSVSAGVNAMTYTTSNAISDGVLVTVEIKPPLEPVTMGLGSYTLTGQSASFIRSYRLVAELGSYALTGYNAAINKAYTVVMGLGSYALTGYSLAISRTYRLVMGLGSYTLTGIDAIIKMSYKLVASLGSYALTGYDLVTRGQRYTYDTKPTSSYSNDTKPTSSYSNDTKPTSSYSNDTKPSSSYSNDTKPSNSWINDEKL